MCGVCDKIYLLKFLCISFELHYLGVSTSRIWSNSILGLAPFVIMSTKTITNQPTLLINLLAVFQMVGRNEERKNKTKQKKNQIYWKMATITAKSSFS